MVVTLEGMGDRQARREELLRELEALEAGFRSFFTSPEAGNQRGFATAIRDSGIARSELFIAGTVLSDDAEGYRQARALTQRRRKDMRGGAKPRHRRPA